MPQYVVSFISLDHLDALENYAIHKLTHVIEKFSLQPTKVEINFREDSPSNYSCCVVLSGSGYKEHLCESGKYLFDCIDRLGDTIQVVLRKHKDKQVDLHRFRVEANEQRWEDEGLEVAGNESFNYLR